MGAPGIQTFASLPLSAHQLEQIEGIKAAAAAYWNLLNDIAIEPGNQYVGRLVSLAKTDIESSVMWAVKAYSRQD